MGGLDLWSNRGFGESHQNVISDSGEQLHMSESLLNVTGFSMSPSMCAAV